MIGNTAKLFLAVLVAAPTFCSAAKTYDFNYKRRPLVIWSSESTWIAPEHMNKYIKTLYTNTYDPNLYRYQGMRTMWIEEP